MSNVPGFVILEFLIGQDGPLKVRDSESPFLADAEMAGAGEGNRTLVFSLEGCCSTIELHPHRHTMRQTVFKSQRRTQKDAGMAVWPLRLPAFAQAGLAGHLKRPGDGPGLLRWWGK